MKSVYRLLACCIWLFATALAFGQGTVPNPVGLWEFSNSGNLGQSTLGPALAIEGTAPTYSATRADDGSTTLNGVIATQAGAANRLRVTHGIGANGGGSLTNEYTLLYDIFSPSGSRSSWRCLFQTNPSNPVGDDGDYFIRNSDDKMGTYDLGYSNALDETRWKRVMIVVDLPSVKTYVDGVLFHTYSNQTVDGRYALNPAVLLFGDEDGENASLNVNAVALWGVPLSAAEIQALGVAGAPIQGVTLPPATNTAPVITEGATFAMPGATKDGPAVSTILHVTDAENNNITWTVSVNPAHGTVSILGAGNSQATIEFTPAAGYVGNDTFRIQASDGQASDSIDMTVTVTAPVPTAWPAPVALWEFDFPVEPTAATIGTDLVAQGSNFTSAAGAFSNDGAMEVPVGSFYRAANQIGANGGGSFTNRYTILWDVFIPSGSTAPWHCFYQTNPSNSDDGDLFIDSTGSIGVGALGYTTNKVAKGQWYRVVLRVIGGQTSGATIWVNGSKWSTGTASGVDGRFALRNEVLLFADENGEDGLIRVSNVALWSDALSDADITNLGAVTGRIANIPKPTPNNPPVITEGATLALNANANAPTDTTFHVTDADGNAIAWSVSSAPTHGSVQILTSNNSQATVRYTPTANYTGTDSFAIRAFDGQAADVIAVSVSVQNGAPVISEGDTYNLSALKDGGQRSVTLNAIDPNGNALTWTMSAAPVHGAVQVTSSNTTGTFAYTPAAGYSGSDSFTARVSDGIAADTLVVNVTVTDPTANPKLTIVSARGTATPAPGVYSHPRNTALTNSVTDEIGATTRHMCTGWTMTGDGPATGTAKTMNMTLTRDSVLTWNFRTEHRVETAISGTGTLNVSSGWYAAGVPLQITATPGAGQYFVGWTGDTAGCQIGGKNIVIPMDRARSTITATFAVNSNFTFIALPDTQVYTSISSPTDLFTRQTQWILNNKTALNIKFVTHLGDVVDSPSSQSMWQRATDALNLLNGQMPYGTCPGNHDIANGDTNYISRLGPNPTHTSSIGRWVDPGTSQTYSWYRGSSPRGYSSYQIVKVNGRDYMFLHLDMDCPDQDMAWAASVLAANPKVLTMVTTHNYLAESGGSGAYGSGTGQRGYTASTNTSVGPDRNRPQEVFDTLVKPFNQVYMVICGHNFATYNIEATNNAGRKVHEVLVDWQSLPSGGNAFLRIMEFRPGQNQIYNTSYSPYLGRYVDPTNDADHQGMMDLHNRYGGEFALTTDFETRFNNGFTVVSPYGGVTPAAGTHQIEDGTPVAFSAQEQVVSQTRYRPISWNITGSQTLSGTGSSASFVHNGNSTLTWNYATEHYLTMAKVGSGIVSTNSGWYSAGANVSVQAQPDAGASFIRWSGDTAGCTINGVAITIPMDRPRGPITAEFTSPFQTYSAQVVSASPSVTPAPATYTYEQGQVVTFSASDVLGADTRRICTGYTVTGAVNQSGSANSFNLTITGNVTVTWNWKTQYLLATTVSGPGTVSTGSGQWVDAAASVAVTATANAGADFLSWSGDTAAGSIAGNQFNITSMTRPVGPLTANFAIRMVTLNVVSSQTTATPTTGSHSYPYGTTVEFSATALEANRSRQRPTAWALTGATTNNGTTPSGSFVITGNTTLTWSWAPEVLLSLSGGLEGLVRPLNAAGWYPTGANVTLTAVPPSLFGFRQWRGDVPAGSTNAAITLQMNQPRAVTPDMMPVVASDGTPHWFLDHFSQVTGGNYEAARLLDIDSDGQNAAVEFIAGMSNLDALERFSISNITESQTSVTITLPMRMGRRYQLLGSQKANGPYSPIGTPLDANLEASTLTFPRSGNTKFYKVEAQLRPGGAVDPDPIAKSHLPQLGSLKRTMKLIPAGSFTQGENTGPLTVRPEHQTNVSAFFMDKYEVTRADWEMVATWAQANGYDISPNLRFNVPNDNPAVAISWYDSVKWCNARSEMEGRTPVYFTDANGTNVYRTGEVDLTSANVNWAGDGYRLPTEAEWERASRGGLDGQPYPWGSGDASLRANHWNFQVFTGRAPNEAYPYTEAVGLFDGTAPGGAADSANAYGLYDMVGNAWEWTWDRMGDYSADTQYDPHGPDTGTVRVQRGGSWWNYVDQSTNFLRLPFPPNGVDDYGMNGFRCVRSKHPNE